MLKYSIILFKQIADFPDNTYARCGRGPMGVNYLIQTKGGWMHNDIYYQIDSDDVESVVTPIVKN